MFKFVAGIQKKEPDFTLESDDAGSCIFCGRFGFQDAFYEENLDSPKQRFHLGNGQKTRDQEEAYSRLLQRDFPGYNFEDGEQKQILFTPPQYLHKRMDIPDTSEPEFEKNKDELNPGSVANIEAEDFEALLFYSVKHFLNTKCQNYSSKNITVLQGWCRTWTILEPKPAKGKGDKHGLIVLDGNRKLIILFEAKMSLSNEGTIEKATTQLANQAKYFREHHGHVLCPDWKIATVIAYKCPPLKLPFESCKPFLLEVTSLENLEKMWKGLDDLLTCEKNQGTPFVATKVNCYKSLVGRVVGFSTERPLFVSTIKRCRDEVKMALTCNKDFVSSSMPPEKRPARPVRTRCYG